jgi:hypothetical protein
MWLSLKLHEILYIAVCSATGRIFSNMLLCAIRMLDERRSIFIRNTPISSSERILHKDYDRKVSGRQSQGIWRQNELIGGKPPIVKQLWLWLWLKFYELNNRVTTDCSSRIYYLHEDVTISWPVTHYQLCRPENKSDRSVQDAIRRWKKWIQIITRGRSRCYLTMALYPPAKAWQLHTPRFSTLLLWVLKNKRKDDDYEEL